MAHRSKKKHIKHLHEHEAEPRATTGRRPASSRDASKKAPSAGRRFTTGTEAKRQGRSRGQAPSVRATARPGVAKSAGRSRRSAAEGAGARQPGVTPRPGAAPSEPKKQPGLVRRLARAARDRTAETPPTVAAVKGPGLVRSLARKATRKLAAQPRKVIDRAKDRVASRVRSLLRDA
jgi:hypothetical protein